MENACPSNENDSSLDIPLGVECFCVAPHRSQRNPRLSKSTTIHSGAFAGAFFARSPTLTTVLRLSDRVVPDPVLP